MQVHVPLTLIALSFVLLPAAGYMVARLIQYRLESKRRRMEKEMLQIHADILSLYAKLKVLQDQESNERVTIFLEDKSIKETQLTSLIQQQKMHQTMKVLERF